MNLGTVIQSCIHFLCCFSEKVRSVLPAEGGVSHFIVDLDFVQVMCTFFKQASSDYYALFEKLPLCRQNSGDICHLVPCILCKLRFLFTECLPQGNLVI